MSGNIGPILAGLGAGAASAYSPYAARGIQVGAGVLGAFGERRQQQEREQRIQQQLATEEKYRRLQEQRLQEALALEGEKSRREQETRKQAGQLIDENTQYGEPGQPFRAPAGGPGRGIPEPQARILQLINAGDAPEALSFLLKQTSEVPRQPLSAIQRIPLTQGEKLKAKTQEGYEYERDVPKPAARNLRFDVYDSNDGYRVQTVTDEETGGVVKQTKLGRIKQPSEVSIQGYTDEQGNRVVAGVSKGGGIVFRRSLGKTQDKASFNMAQFRKDLSLRKQGKNVRDPEVQQMDPATAAQTLRDLTPSGGGILGELEELEELERLEAARSGPAHRALTPEEEAERILNGPKQ